MPNVSADLDRFVRPKLIWLYEFIVRLTPEQWTLAALLCVMSVIIGWRLTRFTKPEIPRVSQIVRDFAKVVLLYPSLMFLAAMVLVWSAYFGLSWSLDSVSQGIESLSMQIVSVLIGGFAGLAISAIAYYFLIPGIELPSRTLADPVAKINAVGDYDPETYFHV